MTGCSQPPPEISHPIDTIVFSAADAHGRFQIYSMNPDGTQRRQHTAQGNNVTPSWTPDGKRIIFASDRSGTREIYLMDKDGAGLSRLATPISGNKLVPNMAHDLSKIVFALEGAGRAHGCTSQAKTHDRQGCDAA